MCTHVFGGRQRHIKTSDALSQSGVKRDVCVCALDLLFLRIVGVMGLTWCVIGTVWTKCFMKLLVSQMNEVPLLKFA